ncbi:MAG: hypothetical protein A2086_02960 [Spirochaetes bacterium GWD1_27_9]|nr:MAG: hypothetical protein A2Y34_10050 [Spirochaetes bacterium GWC1_27_15]OHD45127.1 MAG: hypothetical protein A2086_02960 [Spirochaetes bacterium GWD1_27_9]
MTELIEIKKSFYEEEIIQKISDYIKEDKIIIMPSDTIYGFLCSQKNESILREIKMRDEKPFLNLISKIDDLAYFDIDTKDYIDILQKNWAGPVTFLLKNNNNKKIGVRLPDWDVLTKIIDKVGEPLISTSVNFSGMPPLNDINQIISDFKNKVSLIVCDFDFKASVASTIVDFDGKSYKIVREGTVKFKC